MQHPEKKPLKTAHKRRAVWLTAALLALGIALVLCLPAIFNRYQRRDRPAVTAELPFRTLLEQEESTLSSIEVRHLDGDSYTLLYRGGSLYLQTDSGETLINDAYTAEMVRCVTQFNVENTVSEQTAEVEAGLADMGLSPAQITVTARYTGGEMRVISLGHRAPESTYTYYRLSGVDGVYLCDVGTAECFQYTAGMLLPISQPALYATLVDTVTLERGGSELSVRFTADEGGKALGQVLSAGGYPMDGDTASALLSAVTNLRLGAALGPWTRESGERYGLNRPQLVLTVHQQAGYGTRIDAQGAYELVQSEEQTLRFTIGNEHDEYFVYVGYGGQCYDVSAFLLKTLLATTADSLCTRTPANLGDMAMASIVLQKGNEQLDIRVARTEVLGEDGFAQTDENGAVLYEQTATLGGEPIPMERVEQLLQRLKDLRVSGDLPADYAPSTAAPRWVLRLTTQSGMTRTLAGYPLDALSDALEVDGVSRCYLQREAIDIVFEGVGD